MRYNRKRQQIGLRKSNIPSYSTRVCCNLPDKNFRMHPAPEWLGSDQFGFVAFDVLNRISGFSRTDQCLVGSAAGGQRLVPGNFE